MLSAKQLEAISLVGAAEVQRRGRRVVEPAYGRKAIQALLRIGYVQDDAVLQRVFREAGVSKEAARAFEKAKVVVRHVENDGRLEVLPNIPGITDDNLSQYAGSDVGGHYIAPEVVDERVVKYKLNHVFTDVTLIDKLSLSPRRLQGLKRLAASDPSAAASSLTDYLRANGFPNATVTAGDYARSLGRMREVIHQFAITVKYQDAAAPAIFTHNEVFVSHDGFVQGGPVLCTVRGPVKFATEVLAIYQLAICYGPDRLMFLLGIETAFLRINIYDETRRVYYDGQLEGYSSLHGIQPMDSSLPSELTANQQSMLRQAASKVFPIHVNDMVTGTAVQVADHHWIMNEHTLTHAGDADLIPMLRGKSVTDWRSVGNDVAMVKQVGRAPAQWRLRRADVGERVVLCYSVGQSVEYSEVLRVQSTTSEHLFLSESAVLRKGASGAVAIALRDSAMLGIFSTVRHLSVVCSIFDSSTFGGVTDFESVASSSCGDMSDVVEGNVTYKRMVRKGLSGFMDGISDATAPLYAQHGRQMHHAGLVVRLGDNWQTTVDPDQQQLVTSDSVPLVFRSETVSCYTVVSPPPILSPIPNVRAAMPGERVFVFTKDSFNKPAMTAVKIVTHCLSDQRGFVVEDFGDSTIVMTGGVVIAERDAAVLGQFLRREVDSFGDTVTRCVPLMVARLPEVRNRITSTSVVSELKNYIAASDVAVYELASVGMSAIKLAGEHAAYRHGEPMSDGGFQYTNYWENHSDRVVEEFGLQAVDWDHFRGVPRRSVAEAFMAIAYMHDPGGFETRLRPFMLDTSTERTPITAEFPRPDSAAGSSASRETRMPVEIDGKSVRLRELELRMDALTKRLSLGDLQSQ